MVYDSIWERTIFTFGSTNLIRLSNINKSTINGKHREQKHAFRGGITAILGTVNIN